MNAPNMMLTLLAATVPLLGLAAAVPTADHSNRAGSSYPGPEHYWAPPGPGDVRSPCPLLNSFANHAIIPHSGKGLTIAMLGEAFNKYINTGSDVAEKLGTIALTTHPTPNAKSFDLNDIDAHNVIEHDGSLSRGDYFFGDDHSFNILAYGQTAEHFTYPTIDIPTAAKARYARMTADKAINPAFNLTTAGFMGSFLESSFYLSVFGDPYKGVARTDWVNYWFTQQRLPYALGWSPRALETNLTTLGAMAQKVMDATPKAPGTPAFDHAVAAH